LKARECGHEERDIYLEVSVLDLIYLVPLGLVLVLLVWLILRASRSQHRFVKWVMTPTITLVFLFLTALTGIVLAGVYQLYKPHPAMVSSSPTSSTPEQIARGQYLSKLLCAECHSSNNQLPLSGGQNLSREGLLALGVIYPPNLTPAGAVQDWPDAAIVRAIREGVDRDGRTLPLMAYAAPTRFRNLSDADVQAIVAYMRSQSVMHNELPPQRHSLVLAFIIGAGIWDVNTDPVRQPVAAPARAPTSEYGHYFVRVAGCIDCHGSDLKGSNNPTNAPVSPDITTIAPTWTEAGFIQAMRTGMTPTGRMLNSDIMPWKDIGQLEDVELIAMYHYLRTLSPTAQVYCALCY
jgi:mono/diheme cytochrome c family protein